MRFTAGDDRPLPATLRVFDARGAEIGRASGSSAIRWPTRSLAPGAYYYRLERAGAVLHGRFVRLP